jgi:hypothetical protein
LAEPIAYLFFLTFLHDLGEQGRTDSENRPDCSRSSLPNR